jgi:hypothetical protein
VLGTDVATARERAAHAVAILRGQS